MQSRTSRSLSGQALPALSNITLDTCLHYLAMEWRLTIHEEYHHTSSEKRSPKLWRNSETMEASPFSKRKHLWHQNLAHLSINITSSLHAPGYLAKGPCGCSSSRLSPSSHQGQNEVSRLGGEPVQTMSVTFGRMCQTQTAHPGPSCWL